MGDSRDLPGTNDELTREGLARYMGGDVEAGDALFARLRATLLDRARRHHLMRPIQKEVSSEDVVQEVLGRALASGLLAGFEDRGRGSLEATFAQVLERTMVDFARRFGAEKRGGRFSRVDEIPPAEGRVGDFDHLVSPETSPTGRARENELVELARRVLEAQEYSIWELIELKGQDSNEVASRTDLTPSAVRGVLFRAKAKLVRALGDDRGPSRPRA